MLGLAARLVWGQGHRAGLSAAGPLAALATAYWRLGQLAVSPGFAALALVLAGLLLAAERMARRPELVARSATLIG